MPFGIIAESRSSCPGFPTLDHAATLSIIAVHSLLEDIAHDYNLEIWKICNRVSTRGSRAEVINMGYLLAIEFDRRVNLYA